MKVPWLELCWCNGILSSFSSLWNWDNLLSWWNMQFRMSSLQWMPSTESYSRNHWNEPSLFVTNFFIQCADGSCGASVAECTKKCEDNQIMCYDGTCQQSFIDCPKVISTTALYLFWNWFIQERDLFITVRSFMLILISCNCWRILISFTASHSHQTWENSHFLPNHNRQWNACGHLWSFCSRKNWYPWNNQVLSELPPQSCVRWNLHWSDTSSWFLLDDCEFGPK